MSAYTDAQRQGIEYHRYVVSHAVHRGACAVCGNRRSAPCHRKAR
jgi:hypothetical protein